MTNFLKRSDYEQSIQEEHLEEILETSLDFALEQAELAGIKEVQLYLRGVFDLDLLFPTINDWSAYTEYDMDEYVWYEDVIYQAKNDIVSAGSNTTIPSTDTENWKVNDPRDAFLLQKTIDIVLYHIHKTISPREVPKHRLIAYDQALYNLKMIRDGELSSDYPTVESPTTSPTIISDVKNNWYW